MGYHDDGPRQLGRIRSNLASCRHTSAAERDAFQADIVGACVGTADDSVTVGDISNVKHALRRRALGKDLLLQGEPRQHMSGISLLNTKTEDHFMNICSLNLQDRFGLDPGAAEDVAQELLTELESQVTLLEAMRVYAGLELQKTGSPLMWLANPSTATPAHDHDLGLLPARLGLKPAPARHVLFQVTAPECLTARFADSGGDEYWLPGGSTAPIEECPTDHSGLEECVVKPLTLSALRAPMVRFDRTI
jgi:hypothetical protein